MKSYLTSIFFFLLLLISCGGSKTNLNDSLLTGTVNQNNTTTQVNTNNQGNSSTIQTPSYSFGNELVWSDEFDEDGPVSSDNWNIETVPPDNGSWYNGELQYYTDREENIKVEDGFLNITAKREDFSGKLYTSARIHTQDKYEFKYGRIEMRAKLPNWEGMWPAFWMMGANYDTLGWPFCGELDILEHGDYVKSSTIDDPGLISAAVHYGPSDHKSQYATIPNTIYFDTGQENFVRAETTIENPFEDFHTYSLQWAPDKLEFYVDEELYFEFPLSIQSSPFDKPFFMLINLAVGGHWTDGFVASGFTEATYKIDYVRVYQ